MGDPFPLPPTTALSHRSPEPTAYDAARFSSIIDWTPRCLSIHGIPRVIVSAEFHYFRVPDRNRWRPILAAIRSAGFNAVRLYVMWGYHSPAEDVLDFSGNRDLDYLLRLCEELQLFAIPAPGPYICAEVQGGGYPLWLVAKRELRIRHLVNPPVGMFKRWDQAFHDHCAVYFEAVMRIFVRHERTTNPHGCVIALQVENELNESVAGLVGGLNSELRKLTELARAVGSTVPVFHNDAFPAGSWSNADQQRVPKKAFRKVGEQAYRTDLYGFDLYFTFPPGDKSGDLSSMQVGMVEAFGLSSCLNLCGVGGAGVGGSDASFLKCLYSDATSAPPPELQWAATSQMPNAVDTLEEKFLKMGGAASAAPIFVAETQVGWINQWGRLRGYDEIYNFFGNDFSATLLCSLLAQGVSMTNHYMAYGGTNHGAVGDTEVYSSYDYSAFIREFGMLSERGRRMRLASLFMRTFASRGLAHGEILKQEGTNDARRRGRKSANATKDRVKATLKGVLLNVREAVIPDDASALSISASVKRQPPAFAFLRNLVSSSGRFNLIVDGVVLPCFLPRCEAMTSPLHYPLCAPGGELLGSVFACTVPVTARAVYAGSELWVLRVREAEKGRLVLTLPETERGICVKFATLGDDGRSDGGVLTTSDQDEGAATSLLSAPLEELGLNQWEPFDESSTPVAVRTSTEANGLCFSLAFSGQEEACVLAVYAGVGPGSSVSPLLRVLCLSETDSSTFSAECCGDDPYFNLSDSSVEQTPFAAAWGADEIGFLPKGELHVAYSAHQVKSVFLLHGGDAPSDFSPIEWNGVASIIPGLYEYAPPTAAVSSALKTSMFQAGPSSSPLSDPLDPSYELPVDGWEQRQVDWTSDVAWKSIKYSERDPLDHLMSSGHTAYRLRFRSSSKKISVVLNIRHFANVWCNGVACGSQVVFSHNVASAGAMHAVDLHQAGKQRHDLTPGLARLSPDGDGMHEVVILVFSFGQSRSPFLLNDVRNKRGLLSARITRLAKVTDVEWAIAGVDVRSLENAYATSGLPLEPHMEEIFGPAGFESVSTPRLVANDGLVYFRTTFKVPSCSVFDGNVRYPLRLKVDAPRRSVAILWVNGVNVGRYVQATGPQTNFYVPEGLITELKNNSLVVAVYGPTDGDFAVRILPWVVDRVSGNLEPAGGQVFALREARFSLQGGKPSGAEPILAASAASVPEE